MSRTNIEFAVGVLVLTVTALILFVAYNTTNQAGEITGGFPLIAKFRSIEGVHVGSDVRIDGIKVGSIVSETLNPSTYLAVVRLKVDPTIRLPDDSTAEIRSSLLFGRAYLTLVPGSSKHLLQSGGEIKHTRPPVSLDDLIGKYIFNPSGA